MWARLTLSSDNSPSSFQYLGLQVGPPSTVKTELVIMRDPDNLMLRHVLLSIAKAIVFYVCPLSQIVAVIWHPIINTENQLDSEESHDVHILFCSMFVNLTMVHKPFHGTPQIKGQYALLYLKWLDQNWPLDSSLTLKELIVLFHLFLVFGFCFCFLFFLFFCFFFWCLVLGFFCFFLSLYLNKDRFWGP